MDYTSAAPKPLGRLVVSPPWLTQQEGEDDGGVAHDEEEDPEIGHCDENNDSSEVSALKAEVERLQSIVASLSSKLEHTGSGYCVGQAEDDTHGRDSTFPSDVWETQAAQGWEGNQEMGNGNTGDLYGGNFGSGIEEGRNMHRHSLGEGETFDFYKSDLNAFPPSPPLSWVTGTGEYMPVPSLLAEHPSPSLRSEVGEEFGVEGVQEDSEVLDEWEGDDDAGYVRVEITEEVFFSLEEEAAASFEAATVEEREMEVRIQRARPDRIINRRRGASFNASDAAGSSFVPSPSTALSLSGLAGSENGIGGDGLPSNSMCGSSTYNDHATRRDSLGSYNGGLCGINDLMIGSRSPIVDDPMVNQLGEALMGMDAAGCGDWNMRASGATVSDIGSYDPGNPVWPRAAEDFAFSQNGDDQCDPLAAADMEEDEAYREAEDDVNLDGEADTRNPETFENLTSANTEDCDTFGGEGVFEGLEEEQEEDERPERNGSFQRLVVASEAASNGVHPLLTNGALRNTEGPLSAASGQMSFDNQASTQSQPPGCEAFEAVGGERAAVNNENLQETEKLGSFYLRVVSEHGRTGFQPSKTFHAPAGTLVAGRYQVVRCVGQATFSFALHCLDHRWENRPVCLKVVKNNKDYFDQSLDEIRLLRLIAAAPDPKKMKRRCLRMFDSFYFKEHLFIVTELLGENLYELDRRLSQESHANTEPSGSTTNTQTHRHTFFRPPRLQSIIRQVLEALSYINSLGLMHCDIKPENLCWVGSLARVEVKLIDFGSASFEKDQACGYVQSRSYRAPEVVLGMSYGSTIDTWSLGAVCAELLTGSVLFQSTSSQTLLARIESIIGRMPTCMIEEGPESATFYTGAGRTVLFEEGEVAGTYTLLYPKRTSLRHRLCPYGADSLLLDLLSRMLALDPTHRITAREALSHPWFNTGRF